MLIWAEACSKSRGAERQRGMSGAGAPARHPPTRMTWHAQRSSAHSGTNMCMHLHKNVHTLAQTRAHTGKNTRTYWHKHVHMLAQTRAHAGTNTCTCWHKHVHMLAQTRAHTSTNTCTCWHKHRLPEPQEKVKHAPQKPQKGPAPTAQGKAILPWAWQHSHNTRCSLQFCACCMRLLRLMRFMGFMHLVRYNCFMPKMRSMRCMRLTH